MTWTEPRLPAFFSFTFTECFAPKSNILVLPLAHLILSNLSSFCKSIYAGFRGETRKKEATFKDNIKIYFEEIEWKVMDGIHLAQDRDEMWTVLYMVMKHICI
jgi:hypothetical protein